MLTGVALSLLKFRMLATRRAGCRVALAASGALLGLALGGNLAHATPSSLYKTNRVLAHNDNECVGQKASDCITIGSARLPVQKGGSRLIAVTCSARFPHLVGWDSQQHEHLRLVVTSAQPGDKTAPATTRPDRLSVVAINNADVRGYAKLFAGCSRKPWHGTPFASSREGIPGNHVGFVGDKP